MKEPKNIATRVANNLLNMVEMVSTGISKMSGGEPFDTQQISKEKQRKIYDNLTPEEMFQLIGKHGKEKVEAYVRHMEESNG